MPWCNQYQIDSQGILSVLKSALQWLSENEVVIQAGSESWWQSCSRQDFLNTYTYLVHHLTLRHSFPPRACLPSPPLCPSSPPPCACLPSPPLCPSSPPVPVFPLPPLCPSSLSPPPPLCPSSPPPPPPCACLPSPPPPPLCLSSLSSPPPPCACLPTLSPQPCACLPTLSPQPCSSLPTHSPLFLPIAPIAPTLPPKPVAGTKRKWTEGSTHAQDRSRHQISVEREGEEPSPPKATKVHL